MKPKWTEDETEALRRALVGDGSVSVFASQAARALSEELHRPVTKNMVIGRCWRTGIELPLARGPRKPPAAPTPNPFPDNPHGCLWSYGDPGPAGYRFCGGSKMPGKPYCSIHAAVAYEPPKKAVA